MNAERAKFQCSQCHLESVIDLFSCPSCGSRNSFVQHFLKLPYSKVYNPSTESDKVDKEKPASLDSVAGSTFSKVEYLKNHDELNSKEKRIWNAQPRNIAPKINEKTNDRNDGKNSSDMMGLELLYDVEADERPRISTGITSLDSLLGSSYDGTSGAVVKTAICLSAQPGTGKSTILLQIGTFFASCGLKTAIILGEEHKSRIKLRADSRLELFERFPDARKNLFIINNNDTDYCLEQITSSAVTIVIVDSIHSLMSSNCHGSAKSDLQVEYGARKFAHLAHSTDAFAGDTQQRIVFIIYHSTKAGDVDGPNGALHDMDCVLIMEHFNPKNGESLLPKNSLGFVRIKANGKNRDGCALGEVHLTMTKKGLIEGIHPELVVIPTS